MNINSINPISLPANQPGHSVTRQIVVTGVEQQAPVDVEVAVTATAAGNDPATRTVSVTLNPEDATPTAAVSVPDGAGFEATVSSFGFVPGATPYWNATLTITTV